ncbi:sugar phosphate isomerase/epimerase family protein [Anaeromassilibacillus sp. SJQ-5]|mgnify:FL=1
MYPFSIGVILDSFRTDLTTALDKAVAVGASGLQVYATSGAFSPESLSPQKRREFLDMCKSRGLTISALCGDLGQGFANPEKNPELIERSKRILDLAKDLETDVVTTHIGVVPADTDCDTFRIMQDACGQLAAYADSLRAHFAIETGPELSAVLKTFLDTLHSTGVAVNLDPANLVMVAGDDPVKAVHNLKEYIVHTHAKDGRMLRRVNPETIYNGTLDFAEAPFIELPLGQGDVDFPAYLSALNDIGYTGYLTIEREVGDDPEGDIRLAVNFLQSLIR